MIWWIAIYAGLVAGMVAIWWPPWWKANERMIWWRPWWIAIYAGLVAGMVAIWWPPWWKAMVVAGGVAGGVVLLWAVWWRLPRWQVTRLLGLPDDKAKADVEDNFRKTIGQLLGGAAVLIGAGLAYLQFSQQQQASREQQRVAQQQFLQQQQAAHELLISNQVAKGFEQLGSDKVVVRLGGIYALEGAMNTSEQYHQPVLEALCAFVRDGTSTATGDGPPATDIQAALTVIGRRAAIRTGVPDLSNAHIPKANLSHADLRNAELGGANLSYARLPGADLSDAYLGVMRVTHLLPVGPGQAQVVLNVHVDDQVNLSHADLFTANLSRANLGQADLSDAILIGTNLTGARVEWSDLRNAKLVKADLTGALLDGAKFDGANLIKATISQTQLDKACGKDVTLDPGLTLKPCSK